MQINDKGIEFLSIKIIVMFFARLLTPLDDASILGYHLPTDQKNRRIS